jgi:hypothetical protein
MFPVQTNRIFLTPLKARKGDTLNKAVQAVEKERRGMGREQRNFCLRDTENTRRGIKGDHFTKDRQAHKDPVKSSS